MPEQEGAAVKARATSSVPSSGRGSAASNRPGSKPPKAVRGVSNRDPTTKILARIADRKAASSETAALAAERVPLQETKTGSRPGSLRRNNSAGQRPKPATGGSSRTAEAATSKSASTSPVPDENIDNIEEMPLSELLNRAKTASTTVSTATGRLDIGRLGTGGGGGFFQEKGAGLEIDDGKSTQINPAMIKNAVLKAGVVDYGKLVTLDLSGQCIARVCSLNKCHLLRALDLSFNRIRVIEGVDTLYQLRDLRFTCNKIERLSGLEKLSALETLHVQVNRIEHIGRGTLATQKRLRDLRLDGNSISRLCNLEANVQLTNLDVSQNNISRIEGLGLMGQMECLNLAFNEIPTMEGLTAFGRLRELNLASNQLTAIDSLKHCGALQVLRLDNNLIADLEGLVRMPKLLEFYAAGNPLSTAAHTIAHCLPGLEFLDLGDNQIGGIYELDALAGLTGLIELKLAGNPVCSKQGYAPWTRNCMTSLDVLDAVDVRAERRRAATPAGGADDDLLAPAAEEADAFDSVLDRGGVTIGKARQHKELAEVLSIEEFESIWHSIRDGLTTVKEGLASGIYQNPAAAPAPAPAVDASRPVSTMASSRPVSMRRAPEEGDGQPTPKKAGGAFLPGGRAGYSRAEQAVSSALARKPRTWEGPSLKEMMAAKERERSEGKARMASYASLAGADRSVFVYRHMFEQGGAATPAGGASAGALPAADKLPATVQAPVAARVEEEEAHSDGEEEAGLAQGSYLNPMAGERASQRPARALSPAEEEEEEEDSGDLDEDEDAEGEMSEGEEGEDGITEDGEEEGARGGKAKAEKEDADDDGVDNQIAADLEYVPYSKPWNVLTKAEMLREVQGLYDNEDETMGERGLLTARAEMTQSMLRQQKNQTDYEAYNVSREVDILLDASMRKSNKKAREGSSNIPGEIVEGPPEPSTTAKYERAHDFHVVACAEGLLALDGIPAGKCYDAIDVALSTRSFLSGYDVAKLPLSETVLQVLRVLDEDTVTACQAAAKAAIAAKLVEVATEAMGDMYPVMLPRMILRNVQYDIASGAAASAVWRVGKGFTAQVDLLAQIGISHEVLEALLASTVDAMQGGLGEDGAALVRGRVDAFMGAVAAEQATSTERADALAQARADKVLTSDDMTLLELWEGAEAFTMNEELDRIRARELEVNGVPDITKPHPYTDPTEWREWVEKTAFEDYMGHPMKIEDVFLNMFNNLPAASSKQWMLQAGVVDQELNLIRKVNRTWVPTPDFGPRYAKNPIDGLIRGAGGEERGSAMGQEIARGMFGEDLEEEEDSDEEEEESVDEADLEGSIEDGDEERVVVDLGDAEKK
mmetsp:Transcript_7989/g.18537  ORF Transcript_7989/g.18537 Transcript_7989/m.18537 type:complete len:1331 (+) Transcript_7989:3-3995(+)